VMHEREKSDRAIVALKPASDPLRSWRSQGRGPRGMRAGKACAGLRTGYAYHRHRSAYGKQYFAVRHPRLEPYA
jgi:hypothetical protein